MRDEAHSAKIAHRYVYHRGRRWSIPYQTGQGQTWGVRTAAPKLENMYSIFHKKTYFEKFFIVEFEKKKTVKIP